MRRYVGFLLMAVAIVGLWEELRGPAMPHTPTVATFLLVFGIPGFILWRKKRAP